MNNSNFSSGNKSVKVSLSATEIADALADQYEITSLIGDTALYREICLIIAVVLTFHPDCYIHVAGMKMTVGHLQEMYGLLTGMHLEMVASKFCDCTYEIKNRVAWFRTALYNSVMECESYYTNQVKKDMG